MPPELHHSEVVFRGRAFSVRVDQVEIKPGVVSRLDIVDHPDAVTIVPVDAAGDMWFIRQYRHPAGADLLELPAGTLKAGEDPALAANRELQEEIGMRAENLELAASFWLAPGYSTEQMHVYVATDLSPAPLEQDEDEVITIEKVPVTRAARLALDGTLRDAKSIAAVLVVAHQKGW